MTRRDRLMLLGVALVVLAVAGWFLALAPMRKQSSDLAGQIAVQRQTLDSVRAEIAAGVVAKRAYARDYATVARLGAAIPEDDNVASLLVQLQQASNASVVDFRSLRATSSSGAAAPAPAPPAATTTSDAAAATQISVATLPPGAAVGAAGFPTMPFSFAFTGSFFQLSEFVGRVQRYLVVGGDRLGVGGRFMTLDGIALTEAVDGFPHMKVSVTATAYLLPADQGLTAGATESGPATGASAGTPGNNETASTVVPGATATATPLVR